MQMKIICGVVRIGAYEGDFYGEPESTMGWFIDGYSGGLYGNGKDYDERVGGLELGQVLTM